MNIDLWPLVVYTGIVLAIVGAMLGLSFILGQRRHDRATDDPFESGIVSVGDAQLRISVHFYLTAILFIIFDLEAVFLFAWAISIREAGWLGYIEVFIFISILITGLIYLWKVGALEWRTPRQKSRQAAIMASKGGVTNIKNGIKL